MAEKNEWVESIIEKIDDREKIRLFYELAKVITTCTIDEYNTMDDDMQNLFEDIANVINDIDNL